MLSCYLQMSTTYQQLPALPTHRQATPEHLSTLTYKMSYSTVTAHENTAHHPSDSYDL